MNYCKVPFVAVEEGLLVQLLYGNLSFLLFHLHVNSAYCCKFYGAHVSNFTLLCEPCVVAVKFVSTCTLRSAVSSNARFLHWSKWWKCCGFLNMEFVWFVHLVNLLCCCCAGVEGLTLFQLIGLSISIGTNDGRIHDVGCLGSMTEPRWMLWWKLQQC